MTAIQQYNNLKGIVTKDKLIALSSLSKKEGQYHIARILDSVICDSDEYNIVSVTPTIGKEKVNNFQDLEELQEIELYEGLGKAIAPNDIYEYVTNSIVDLLKEDIKWDKEWVQDEEGFYNAYNFESKKPYRGINQVLLGSFKRFNPKYPLLQNPYYLTFKQIEKFKGKLRKGAKAKRAIYFTKLYKYEQVEPMRLSFGSYKKDIFIAWLKKNKKNIPVLNGNKALTIPEIVNQSEFPILKYYNVFNGSDVSGIDFKLDTVDISGQVKKRKSTKLTKISEAEEIIKYYPKPSPNFKIGGDGAFYRPSEDLVQMPKMDQFKYIQAYYSTLFHEYIHSTGSKKRLNRTKGKVFGDKDYAFEELVAEFGATFLCAEAGILHFTQRNSAAYIKSWRKNLLEIVKKDNKFIFRASSKAQSATDFILRPNSKGIPKYRKKGSKQKEFQAYGLSVPYVELKPTKRETPVVRPEAVEIQKPVAAVSSKMQMVDPNTTIAKSDPTPKKPSAVVKRPKGLRTMADLDHQAAPMETYTLDTEIGRFLGKLEKKPKGSVVVTLDAPAGSGKTRFFFQVMEDYASIGKRCLFLTLEEHSQSQLFKEKRDDYINRNNHGYISIVDSDEIKSHEDLRALIEAHDVILVDSFGKLKRLIKELKLELDEHLRLAYDGKLFFLIFQRTTGKTMRGGAASEFDGDVILQVEMPTDNFRQNYVTARKNRYNPEPNLKYSVYYKKMIVEGVDLKHEDSPPNQTHKRELVVYSLDS